MVQAGDLVAHLDAQRGIQIGERLVEQQDLGLTRHGAPHGDALALATGKLLGLAIQQLLKLEDARRFHHALFDVVLVGLGKLEAEGHVLVHRHVRVERIGLEDHAHAALTRGEVIDQIAGDMHLTLGDRFQPGDQAQQGRLATA